MTREQVIDLEVLEGDLYELLQENSETRYSEMTPDMRKLWKAWSLMREVLDNEYDRLEDKNE